MSLAKIPNQPHAKTKNIRQQWIEKINFIKQHNPIARSIQLRIVFLLLICLIPVSLGGIYWLDLYTEERLIKLAEQDLVSRGKLLAELMGRLDRERRLDTDFLASHPAVIQFKKQEAQVLLQHFAQFHHWEGDFSIFNMQGDLIAESPQNSFQAFDKLPKWLAESKARGGPMNRLTRNTTIEDSKDCLIMPIISPESNKQVGVLLECIPLSAISRFVNEIGKSIDVDRIIFVNYEGWIYADTGNTTYSQLENRQNLPAEKRVLAGEQRITYTDRKFIFTMPIKYRNNRTWGLILINTEETVQSAIADVNRVGLILVAFIGIIVAYSSWKIIHHSTVPITALTQATSAIADGNLDYVIDIHRQDEIGTLAQSFMNMQSQLKNLIDQEVKDAVYRLELEKGRQIQQDFLPEHLPEAAGWDIAGLFEPARSVSGDFYDAFALDDNYLGLVIGDVCDKGVGAAMFMGLFRSLLRVFSGAGMSSEIYIDNRSLNDDLTDILDGMDPLVHQFLQAVYLTNDYITTEHSSMAMFATLFFGVLDIKTGMLTYINAGHEPVYVLNPAGIKHQLKSSGPAVGMMPKSMFPSHHINLEPGDLLVGYTDGVTDARCPNGEFFGRKRLEQLLIQHYEDHVNILECVRSALLDHIADAVQFDDITMLVVYRN
ncbi:SpoIIE family protein phosphatase [Thermosynechococcaceae cyanobacterium BACA0444]|uniref:SpoIIE family protein phosphatase n=1 Tax=Pseudocalidococcus azoricus BACA0444 TaxID=2918990 RepID=A0AAE4FUN3_9CYAN|nr:SpoIIE family protein phosphatase [Pseudocalidococcus azoricus]MDS3861892.1 SpoIIE family protein phosphatase [Pseudocalidococcus azoricus BACA0444]